jgi:hypothetical protein
MKRELFAFFALILAFVSISQNEQTVSSSQVIHILPEKKMGIMGKVEGVVIQDVKTTSSSVQTINEEETIDFAAEESEEVKGLSRGYRFLPNVRAIKENEYTPSLGKEMLRNNHLVYFRSSGPAHIRVVYDQRRDTLRPLAATLKLKNVSEEIRQNNLRAGWNEYSYQANLKLQYLQSSHENLMDDYQELTSSGATPELEVITATHIIK